MEKPKLDITILRGTKLRLENWDLWGVKDFQDEFGNKGKRGEIESGNHGMLMSMPIFLFYSRLCFAHGCVYTCTVHTDFDCTVVSLSAIRASHPFKGHHTHTHCTDKAKCWAQVPRLKMRQSRLVQKISILYFVSLIFRPWSRPKNLSCSTLSFDF